MSTVIVFGVIVGLGVVAWLFWKNQQADRQGLTPLDESTVAYAQRLADLINESMQLAHQSSNPQTRTSRLAVARQKLEELKWLVSENRFLSLNELDRTEDALREMEGATMVVQARSMAEGNASAEALEKTGDIDGALAAYEAMAAEGVDTPHTYKRLAVLYAKRKQYDDELRVIRLALKHIPRKNAGHYGWFEERLVKKLAAAERRAGRTDSL